MLPWYLAFYSPIFAPLVVALRTLRQHLHRVSLGISVERLADRNMSDMSPTKETAVSTEQRKASGSHRRESVVVDKNLASEEGQAQSNQSEHRTHTGRCCCSRKDGLQTGIATKLYHDRGLRHRFLNHGSPTLDRQYPLILDSSWARWSRLG